MQAADGARVLIRLAFPALMAKHPDLLDDQNVDPLYISKARVLNAAIQDIGMGRYQYYLFVCAGFGWFAYVPFQIYSVRSSNFLAAIACGL